MTSLQGRFLVASPHLGDDNFFRSVVLLVQHDEAGAFGLVLNRPLRQSVQEVWEEFDKPFCNCDDAVYVGGPVEGPIGALHNSRALSDEEVLPGVHYTAREELLDALVRDTPDQFRFFAGYSGWGGGQLEDELEAGGWLQLDATATDVFADPEQVWSQLTRRINLDIVAGDIKSKCVPSDASLN